MVKIIFYSGHVGKRPPPPINYQHIIDGRNSQNNKYQTPRHLIDTTSATFLVLYTHTSNLHTPDPCVGLCTITTGIADIPAPTYSTRQEVSSLVYYRFLAG